MCKPGGGNNRCPIHQRGSIATLNTTTQLTGTPRDEATVVFKELAAEGSNLQPPTQEMVLSFAETQRLHAKYNPTLTHAAREKITNQWEQAKEETPSGGTFHAWKNTLSEVVRRQRSNMRVIGASLALSAVISGCGGAIKEPTPPPTPSPTEVSAPVVPVEKIDYTQNDKFGITLDTTERTDPYGTYQQVTLANDSPLLTYDESIVEESTFYAFSPEEIESAQVVTSHFAVAQQDSTLLWDDTDEGKAGWLEENQGRVVEEFHDDLEQEIKNPSDDAYYITSGNANGWKTRGEEGTEPIYQEGQPRVAFKDAKLASVTAFVDDSGKEYLRFDYEFTTQEDIVQTNQDNATGVITQRSTVAYAVARDGEGGWLLTGWESNFLREGTAAEKFDPAEEYAQPSEEGDSPEEGNSAAEKTEGS